MYFSKWSTDANRTRQSIALALNVAKEMCVACVAMRTCITTFSSPVGARLSGGGVE